MRKLFTLLIFVFLWSTGMTQESALLSTSNLAPKEVQQKETSNSMQNGMYYINPSSEVKSPVSFRPITPKKESLKVTKSTIVAPNPLAPMQGGDVIANAMVIPSLPYNNTGTTAGYTDNYNEVCPFTVTGGLDVVYSYTPAANGVIDITLCGDITEFDTKLYVYDIANPVTGDAIACNDDYCSNALNDYISEISGLSVTAGVTYYIVVDGYSNLDFGIYEITVTNATIYPVPANDDCSTATVVSGTFPQTVNGTTLGATVDCPGVLDWNAVWYAVTLPYATNDLTVDWCGTADMSTVGVVYYSTCPVVCGDYILYDSNVWNICGTPADATTAFTTFLGIPGPTTIYYPAYSVPQMDHVITFNVTNATVTCPAPTALTVTNKTTTTADLGWTPGGSEVGWLVEVGLPGFTPGNDEHVFKDSPATNSVTATGLSAGTAYQFYAQADCGSDVSTWAGPLNFATNIICPVGATPEIEICGDSTNNACNNVLPGNQTSEPIALDQTICGTSFFNGTTRDTDWYSFTLATATQVTLTGKADFDLQLFLLTSPCPASIIASGSALAGVTATVSSQLAPGNYYAWVGPQFTGVFACGDDNAYYVTLTGTLPTIGCGNTNLGLLTPTTTSQSAAYAAGDTYYWTFNATAGIRYTFHNCGSGEDTYLRIYDNSFLLVASNDDFGVVCPESAASLEFTPVTSGTYYVSLAHYSCIPLVNAGNLYYYYTAPLCDPVDQCNYTFRMTDSWGDGWNGNTMAVIQGGVTVQTLSLADGAGPEDVLVGLCDGVDFDLFWNAGGSWAGEVGIEILDPFGTSIYYKAPGTGSQNTLLFTGTTNCTPPAFKTLNLTSVFLEGLYAGGGTMNQAKNDVGDPEFPGYADEITVELHDGAAYGTIVHTATVLLSTTGSATVSDIPAALSGNYYITIRHRNSIETVSATAVSFAGSIINQSFGTPADVYGGNLQLMSDSGYAIFGGDVTQDGVVDTDDMTEVDNNSADYVPGYIPSDITGDGATDTEDMTIVDNNNANYVGAVTP